MANKEQLHRSSFLKKIVKEAANQTAIEKLIAKVKKFKDDLGKYGVDEIKTVSEIFMTALTNFEILENDVKRNAAYLKKFGASVDITSAVQMYAEYTASVFMVLATIECGKMILQKKEFSSKIINRKAFDTVIVTTQKLVNLYKQIVEDGNKVKSLLKDRIAELQQAKTVSPETVKKLTDALSELTDAARKSGRYKQDIAHKAAAMVVQQLQKKYPH